MARRLFILIALTVLSLLHGYGQDKHNISWLKINKSMFEEHVSLLTDRSIYVAGETISLSAFVYYPLAERKSDSKVIYVELININGQSVSQDKFHVDNGVASGTLNIPTDIVSGNYFLKAYTKWMRNFETAEYSYLPIKLFNTSNGISSKNIGKINFNIEKTSPLTSNDSLQIITTADTYQSGERVSLKIETSSNPYEEFIYTVSVTKKQLVNNNSYSTVKNAGEVDLESLFYMPEISGMIVDGKLLDANNKSVEGQSIYLSTLNRFPYFATCKTNDLGDFYFVLPDEFENADFLMAPVGNPETKIALNDEFCKRTLGIGFGEFNVSDQEENLVNDLLKFQKILEFYTEQETTTHNNDLNYYFYGEANAVYYPDNYVDLLKLDEFFFEVVPEITVHYEKDRPLLRTSNWNVFQSSPFLILIDNVVYNDLERIIKIKPSQLERIEIVNYPYLIGESRFSGILHLISKNKNLAGIELPHNYTFQNYTLFSRPDFEISKRTESCDRCPDLRSTLLWKTDISTANEGAADISFHTSDVVGEFIINVYSVSKKDGSKYLNSKVFQVHD